MKVDTDIYDMTGVIKSSEKQIQIHMISLNLLRDTYGIAGFTKSYECSYRYPQRGGMRWSNGNTVS